MKKWIGKKMKMTSIFKDGKHLGVTPVQLEDKADLADLKAGILIRVTGVTKGHGFTGGVKRWSFKGGPATHGQKNRHRAPGSIGNTTPQRVIKGRHMAGNMGMDTRTTINVPVADVNAEKKVVLINGSVPGTIGRKVILVVK
jgi:large subunit ribosomal protein L3